MKCFEGKRSFIDEANYYMEREWMLATSLHFEIDDVLQSGSVKICPNMIIRTNRYLNFGTMNPTAARNES